MYPRYNSFYHIHMLYKINSQTANNSSQLFFNESALNIDILSNILLGNINNDNDISRGHFLHSGPYRTFVAEPRFKA